MEAITTGLTNGLGTIATDVSGLIGTILPIALPIMGMIVAINMSIKIFKKVSNG